MDRGDRETRKRTELTSARVEQSVRLDVGSEDGVLDLKRCDVDDFGSSLKSLEGAFGDAVERQRMNKEGGRSQVEDASKRGRKGIEDERRTRCA